LPARHWSNLRASGKIRVVGREGYRALLSWSSGKDCAWALHSLRQSGEVEVVGLLTTVNEVYDRVAMHAVRTSLLKAQAEAAALPLWTVPIPSPCSNTQYEEAMGGAMTRARQQGIDAVAFGDLFLEDVRAYREQKLAGTGITPLFPLWGQPTNQLAHTMIDAGVRAHVTCVDPRQIPPSFAGRLWDRSFLEELPETADLCGENGEFHTFVSAGPMFQTAISVQTGVITEREGFVFADLLPATPSSSP
jgi:uncharacterized protein (TIGR00290 family)